MSPTLVFSIALLLGSVVIALSGRVRRSSTPAALHEGRIHARSVAAAGVTDGSDAKIVVRISPGPRSLSSPIASGPCVAWKLTVERPSGAQVHATTSFGVMHAVASDGTRVVVEAGPDVWVWWPDTARVVPGVHARVADDVAKLGVADEALRTREERITPGEAIAVRGLAAWRAGTSRDYRDPGRELVLRGTPKHPLLLSGRPEHLS